MLDKIKNKAYKTLRWSERYTKTDMVYLAKGGSWLSGYQVLSSAAAFLLAIAFANLLPKEIYGQYKYVLSIVGIFTILTLPGITTSLVRSVARGFESSYLPALRAQIKWGLLASLGSILLAGYYYLQGNVSLTFSFLIAAIFLPLMDPLSLYGSLLIGQKKFRLYSVYNIIVKIIATICIAVALFLTNNIFIILFAYFFSYTITRFIFSKISLKQINTNTEKDSETIRYGKHLTVIEIINTLAAQLDKVLTFHFLGAAQLAIYSFALAAPEQIKSVLRNISSLAIPKFAENSPTEIKKTIFSKMVKFAILIALIVLIYILLAKYLFMLFFPEYMESVIYSQVFSISLITAASILPSSFLKAQKAQTELYKLNIISPTITIILIAYFVYSYGLMGLIIAKVLGRVVNLSILIWLTKNFNPSKKT